MHPIVKIVMTKLTIIWGDKRRVGASSGTHRQHTNGRVIVESSTTKATAVIHTVANKLQRKRRGALQTALVASKVATWKLVSSNLCLDQLDQARNPSSWAWTTTDKLARIDTHQTTAKAHTIIISMAHRRPITKNAGVSQKTTILDRRQTKSASSGQTHR